MVAGPEDTGTEVVAVGSAGVAGVAGVGGVLTVDGRTEGVGTGVVETARGAA